MSIKIRELAKSVDASRLTTRFDLSNGARV